MQKRTKHGSTWASHKKKTSLKALVSSIFLKGGKIDRANLLKNLILLAAALFLFGTIVFLALFAWYSRDLPDPNALTLREIPQSTKIYDRTGEELLYEISGDEKRTLVTLDDIPDYAEQATIAAEDRKFYQHRGIDVTGLARAVIFAGTRGGGSTLTQQLVKNAILTNERTISRKMKEIILSLALERRYTKDEILQLYLNEIPYGSTNYGIESASRAYYGKSVQELTIAEAATLAALPQIPTVYLNNPDRLKARRDWILESMAELDYITSEELETALAEDSAVDIQLSGIKAPHFVLWVKEQLVEEYGEKTVEQGGLKVITTLDYEKQQIAEEEIAANVETRSELYGFNNNSLVSLDSKTGEILALVGSANFFDEEINGQVNTVLRPLQPGSSFKPLIFAAGFELGYTPNTILWDAVTRFGTMTGAYEPKNFNLKEYGPVTIRQALQGSLNIPAVKMLALVGVTEGVEFAQRLGYTTITDPSRVGLSLVLGGGEVLPLEHAAAYAALADDGKYKAPVAVLRVESANGDILNEWTEPEVTEVLEPNIARMTTNVLADDGARAMVFGTGGFLTLPGRPAAAKTGTTNDSKDAWTAGYTPQMTTVVWTGNTGGQNMNTNAGGSSVAAPVWNAYMRRVHEGLPVEGFTQPEIPARGKAVLDGVLPFELVRIDTISGKLATDRTPEHLVEERVCGEYRPIVSYVNPSDPLGGAPNDPTSHPWYQPWQEAIDRFIVNHNENLEEGQAPYERCDIPTEEDDVHIARNEPDVRIQNPDRNDNVGRSFTIDVNADARRGVARLEVRVNGSVVATSGNSDEINVDLPSWVPQGRVELSVLAYDDADNVGNDSVSINVTEAPSGASLRITSPVTSQKIDIGNEPFPIILEGGQALDSLTVSARNLVTGDVQIITDTNAPDAIMSIPWTIPSSGLYLVVAEGRGLDGEPASAPPIEVLVREPSAQDNFTLTPEPEPDEEGEEAEGTAE
jgi:penicillin-binding protein 1C